MKYFENKKWKKATLGMVFDESACASYSHGRSLFQQKHVLLAIKLL